MPSPLIHPDPDNALSAQAVLKEAIRDILRNLYVQKPQHGSDIYDPAIKGDGIPTERPNA